MAGKRKIGNTSFEATTNQPLRRQSSLPDITANTSASLSSLILTTFKNESFVKGLMPAMQTAMKPLIEEMFETTMNKLIAHVLPAVIEKSLSPISELITKQQSEISYLQTKLGSLKTQVGTYSRDNDELNYRIEELEQYSRRNSLRFHGLVVNEREDTDDKILFITNSILGLEIKPDQIDRSHIVGKSDTKGKRQVIVKFTSYKTRREVYAAKTKLKNNPENVFISEDLTRQRHVIVKKLLELRKAKMIRNMWTIDGRIFYKINDESRPVLVKRIQELDTISTPVPRESL